MAKNDRILLDGIIDDRVSLHLPSDKRDEAFEYLAFEQILKDFDLSKEEIENGTIDGRQDGGIDGAFILVNGHVLDDLESFVWPKTGSELCVFIVTCKHHDTFKQSTLDKLAATLSETLDFSIDSDALSDVYSEAVLRFRDNLRFAYRKLSPRLNRFSVNISYASRGDSSKVGGEVRSRSSQIRSIVQESFAACDCGVSFIGSTELVTLCRQVPSYSLELPFLEALTRGERYVLLARLSDYYRFVTDEGKLRRYLFDSNVRDFMGLNPVNEDIKTTLNDIDSPDFWWLNNGVTILATSASVVGKAIQIQDIQIVNGLQTTESVFRYFRSGGEDVNERSVLVKVIVTQDNAVRDAIIRATNNQTTVEHASLHATEKIQRDIEDILYRHGLCYERRKNYYANLGHPPSEIVTPLYLASGYVSLILKSPRRATRLRSRFMRSPAAYETVFSEKTPLEVWPKIAQILKVTDAGLESIRPRKGAPQRFLKPWRQVVSFLMISRLMGKFDFSANELIELDTKKVNEAAVRSVWHKILKTAGLYASSRSLAPKRIVSVCKALAKDESISGFRIIDSLDLPPARPTRRVSEDFVERVRTELPPQPWKPGTHKDMAKKLKCRQWEFSAAVEQLVDDCELFRQIDGVLYDSDGNVVGFDSERVDPATMELRQEET